MMIRMFKDKRGNYADVVYFIALAFAFIFTITIVYMLLKGFNSALTSIPIANETQTALNVSNSLVNKFPSGFDWVLPIIYTFFLIFTMWSAMLIESTNKFFVIGIIITFLLVFFSLMMENFWDAFKNDVNILPYVSDFHMTVFMMDHLRYFVLAFCFIIMVLLYARRD